jgi:hypothetical protein
MRHTFIDNIVSDTQLNRYHIHRTLDPQTRAHTQIATMATMAASFAILNANYSGAVVAKLPFVPIPLVQMISHSGLSGTDMTECGGYFIFTLCQIGLRSAITKLLNLSKSSKYEAQGSPFAPPS